VAVNSRLLVQLLQRICRQSEGVYVHHVVPTSRRAESHVTATLRELCDVRWHCTDRRQTSMYMFNVNEIETGNQCSCFSKVRARARAASHLYIVLKRIYLSSNFFNIGWPPFYILHMKYYSEIPTGRQMRRCMNNRDFQPVSRFISATIQDRAIVTVNYQ